MSSPKRAESGRRPGKPGGARDTNRRERIRAIGAAAMRLLLDKGVDSTSIDDITAAAGVAKGSFYRYFADKTELVRALLAPAHTSLEAGFEACGRALAAARDHAAAFRAYRDLGSVLAALVFTHPDVVRLYLQENRAPPLGAREPVGELAALIARHTVELTVQAQKKKILRPISPEVSGLAVVGAAERLLYAVLRGEEVGDPARIAETLTGIVLDGLRPG